MVFVGFTISAPQKDIVTKFLKKIGNGTEQSGNFATYKKP